jgi:hypothetical protein
LWYVERLSDTPPSFVHCVDAGGDGVHPEML